MGYKTIVKINKLSIIMAGLIGILPLYAKDISIESVQKLPFSVDQSIDSMQEQSSMNLLTGIHVDDITGTPVMNWLLVNKPVGTSVTIRVYSGDLWELEEMFSLSVPAESDECTNKIYLGTIANSLNIYAEASLNTNNVTVKVVEFVGVKNSIYVGVFDCGYSNGWGVISSPAIDGVHTLYRDLPSRNVWTNNISGMRVNSYHIGFNCNYFGDLFIEYLDNTATSPNNFTVQLHGILNLEPNQNESCYQFFRVAVFSGWSVSWEPRTVLPNELNVYNDLIGANIASGGTARIVNCNE